MEKYYYPESVRIDMTDRDESNSRRGRRSKVARLLTTYDIEPLGEELEALWTADEDRQSLRDLADYFNRQLLRAAMRDAGMTVLDGEIDNYYRLLGDDDVSPGDRVEARRRLEREGIDVEQLEDDFVTYQAIRTYLTQYRDAEYQGTSGDRIDREADSIRRFTERTESIVQGKIDQLKNANELDVGNPNVSVTVGVYCAACETRYAVNELLNRGHCECT